MSTPDERKALGERLRLAIEDSPFNQSQVAKKADLGENTLSNYVVGKREPRALDLARLARLCKVNPGWLLTGEGSPKLFPVRNGEAEASLALIAEGASSYERTPTVHLPFYDAKLGAGNLGTPTDALVGYGEIIRDWALNVLRINPARSFVLQVFGHSMVEQFFDQDLVIVEELDSYPNDGTFALRWEDDLLIKHVQRFRGKVQLISENARVFPPIEISTDEIDRLEILGRIAGKFTGHIS